MGRKLTAFEKQFVASRRAGASNFSFGGKSYSTKRADEGSAHGTKKNPGQKVVDKSKSKTTLSATAPIPAKRPATTSVPKPNVPIPKPRPNPSGLPSTTTAVPASRQGAQIQLMADDAIKNPMQADPAVLARVKQAAYGVPSPQSSPAAQQAAERARARTPGSMARLAPSSKTPVTTSTPKPTVSVKKGRVKKSGNTTSIDAVFKNRWR